ncbi:flagellar filament capping protein FliD [Legionella clemsonensis]|uniref:Flagellar hook-associated protein 2 n=1 Tax=Legionella clemsonensis TaxID=1867846 RepID=A0A222P1P6_9GAMM|nr:flagellar filament capping protein FliD [Legionella clemsonensis]ASQ45757.1 Flagellar hook-associated protein 2 [Legionella clemsonensis]
MPVSSVGSGLDIKAIVDALVKADLTPAQNRLNQREVNFSTQLSALGLIKSSLAKMQTTMAKLTDLSQAYSLKSTISDESIISATVNGEASSGTYQIEVKQLATKQNLASAAFVNSSTVIGSGSITIDFGTYSADYSSFTANPDKASVTINIAPGATTLAGIRDAINNRNSGVQASIIQDSQGARLTLLSPETGQATAMKITVVDDDGTHSDTAGLSALAYDPTTGVNSLTQTVEAKNSEVMVNGLLLTQSSNQLKDAIAGITLNLKKAQPGTLVDLKIENDKNQLKAMVNEFIKQYNDTMTTINSLTSYNSTTKKGGPMQSDAGIRNLKLNLSKLVSEPVGDLNNPIRTLKDTGIKTNEKGLLVMDETKFTEALDNHYMEIGTLFAKTATVTDSNVRIKSVGTTVKAGNYDLIVDSFTPGVELLGTIGGVHASSSDGLTLSGTGDFKGLSVDILAGGTGSRGKITVTDGLAAKFNDLLKIYLDEKNGEFATRTTQLDKRVEEIAKEREQLEVRAEILTKRYTKQFVALDVLLVKMQGASDFLSQQLANLPQLNRKSR